MRCPYCCDSKMMMSLLVNCLHVWCICLLLSCKHLTCSLTPYQSGPAQGCFLWKVAFLILKYAISDIFYIVSWSQVICILYFYIHTHKKIKMCLFVSLLNKLMRWRLQCGLNFDGANSSGPILNRKNWMQPCRAVVFCWLKWTSIPSSYRDADCVSPEVKQMLVIIHRYALMKPLWAAPGFMGWMLILLWVRRQLRVANMTLLGSVIIPHNHAI